ALPISPKRHSKLGFESTSQPAGCETAETWILKRVQDDGGAVAAIPRNVIPNLVWNPLLDLRGARLRRCASGNKFSMTAERWRQSPETSFQTSFVIHFSTCGVRDCGDEDPDNLAARQVRVGGIPPK